MLNNWLNFQIFQIQTINELSLHESQLSGEQKTPQNVSIMPPYLISMTWEMNRPCNELSKSSYFRLFDSKLEKHHTQEICRVSNQPPSSHSTLAVVPLLTWSFSQGVIQFSKLFQVHQSFVFKNNISNLSRSSQVPSAGLEFRCCALSWMPRLPWRPPATV